MSGNSEPLVSVGVTSYCRPDGLRDVLQGLIQQTHLNLEIIVSDNCSDMSEVEEVLLHFETNDSRVRIFRQAVNLGIARNHSFVVEQATGEYFFWIHDGDHIPLNYVERCLARFEDDSQIVLVGPKADNFMEGQFWFSYMNYTNVGESAYLRLKKLIPLGYYAPSAFLQHFYGLYRRDVVAECVWKGDRYLYKETFSFFFRVAEKGCTQLASDLKLEKFNHKGDFKKWDDGNYILKPARYKMAGAKVELYTPRTLNILSTVRRSEKLSFLEKISLTRICLYHFARVLIVSKDPWWKRLARIPFRVVRKAGYLLGRLTSTHR